MIKLSTKGHYGTQLILDLAIHYGEGPILLKDIAKRQEISVKYLWNLVDTLRIAGFVESYRGRHGGYTLAKNPSEITMKDIILVFEGQTCIVDCVCNPTFCDKSIDCVTRSLWCELSDRVSQTLGAITLKDMVERHKKMEAAIS
jgi:Rrf2 family cysteine metabolism transcriptional repressor